MSRSYEGDDRKRSEPHILVEAGADADNGLNPLHALIGGWTDMKEQYAILDAILDHSRDVAALLESTDSRSGKHTLHLTAAKNEGRLIRHLLARHPSPSRLVNLASALGFDGKTPLHETCYFRYSLAATPFIDSGADVNAVSLKPKLAPVHITASHQSDAFHGFFGMAQIQMPQMAVAKLRFIWQQSRTGRKEWRLY
ncbi:hypothetical protein BU26DRAFT_555033 [Trematosphaeria pertusa]|uniref:Uncharacterized protein n=1 Tax=Trematosphaeria pertusa TaxID=390896 RepID=A0A6A6HXB9_9PLEO|nr:uncharacterized protein BU26DRAFT_555033 [Trematosphaeria pertusa]KAF2242855.1 hypothetical protein BU26DRAFT_555033 [Trematosphaeria pertusa]